MVPQAQPCRVGLEATPSAVIEALRRHVDDCRDRFGSDPAGERVLRRLFACRTGALGMHTCVCEACGWSGAAANACRDRHCPQCQGRATAEWLEGRLERMLPVPHFQVVFTLPAELRPIARCNPSLVYALLFQAGTSVLTDLAAQRMDARLGITAVLHTWTSELKLHPHLHCIVTAGGLSLDGERWVQTREGYLFPQRIMGTMFRGRLLQGLIDALEADTLTLPGDPGGARKRFHSLVHALSKRHERWVVHVEPPAGRSVGSITKYLARYVKRVAISDARIVAVTDEDVTFKTKEGVCTLNGAEFVRRFLLHVLPRGFRKVRHYGLYAPGVSKVRLEIARALVSAASREGDLPEPVANVEADAGASEATGEICPACGEARVRRFFERPAGATHNQARGPP